MKARKYSGWIPQKLCGQVGCVKRTNWFDFGEDLNLDPDLRSLNFTKRSEFLIEGQQNLLYRLGILVKIPN